MNHTGFCHIGSKCFGTLYQANTFHYVYYRTLIQPNKLNTVDGVFRLPTK